MPPDALVAARPDPADVQRGQCLGDRLHEFLEEHLLLLAEKRGPGESER
jgi:hypothetical protein